MRKRSGLSQDSEELIPGEDPPTSPKRNLEGRAEVSEQLKKEQQKFKRDQRKHRREKLQAACGRIVAARSVNKIEPFLSKELPIYRDMKKWSLKRLKALKQRWKKKKKVSMSRVEKRNP